MLMSQHTSEALPREDLHQTVTQGIAALPTLEQLVLSLYYDEELTFEEMGYVLRLPASHVSQLHTQAMHGLRDHLHACQP